MVNTKPRKDSQGNTVPTTVLITGVNGSCGIGFELARLFAQDGYNLVIVGRDPVEVQSAASDLRLVPNAGAVLPLICDLSEAGAPQQLVQRLDSAGTQIDILVNNAGHGNGGQFLLKDIDLLVRETMLNVTSVMILIRLLVPKMIVRGYGKVLNLASTLSFQPSPYSAVYGATKAYVLSLSHALSVELRNTPVKITAFCPGVTRTQCFDRVELDKEKMFKPGIFMSANRTAKKGYRALFRNKSQHVVGDQNNLMVKIGNIFPKKANARVQGPIFQQATHD